MVPIGRLEANAFNRSSDTSTAITKEMRCINLRILLRNIYDIIHEEITAFSQMHTYETWQKRYSEVKLEGEINISAPSLLLLTLSSRHKNIMLSLNSMLSKYIDKLYIAILRGDLEYHEAVPTMSLNIEKFCQCLEELNVSAERRNSLDWPEEKPSNYNSSPDVALNETRLALNKMVTRIQDVKNSLDTASAILFSCQHDLLNLKSSNDLNAKLDASGGIDKVLYDFLKGTVARTGVLINDSQNRWEAWNSSIQTNVRIIIFFIILNSI